MQVYDVQICTQETNMNILESSTGAPFADRGTPSVRQHNVLR